MIRFVRRILAALAMLSGAVACAGCADAYATVRAGATAIQTAAADFRQWDAAHKRQILAAHPECHAAAVPADCFTAALAPYRAQRDPVLRAIEATAPPVSDALAAAKAGTGDPAALAASLASLLADITKAVAALRGAP